MNRDSRATADAGFMSHALSLASAFLEYLKARLQLAGLEGKEASVHYIIILGLLIAALIVVVFGYFFLCFFIVFALAWFFGGSAYIWITLGMALLHFGLAGAALFIAKGRFAEPMFSATINEFTKDQEWLKSKTAKPL